MVISPDNPILRMLQEAEAAKLKAEGGEFKFNAKEFRLAFKKQQKETFENLLEFKAKTGLRETDDIRQETIMIDEIVGTKANHKWGDVEARGTEKEPWQYFYHLTKKLISGETTDLPSIQVSGRGDRYWVTGDGRHKVLALKVLRRMGWPVLFVKCDLNPLGRK